MKTSAWSVDSSAPASAIDRRGFRCRLLSDAADHLPLPWGLVTDSITRSRLKLPGF